MIKLTCSIDSYGINFAPELSPEEKYQRTLKLLFDIRNANRASLLYTSPWSRFQLTPSVVIGTDCIDDDHDGPFKVLDREYKTIYQLITIGAKVDPVKAKKIKIRKNDKATCSIDSYGITRNRKNVKGTCFHFCYRTIGQFMIKLQTCFWERCQGL
jgi:hypothetical protein